MELEPNVKLIGFQFKAQLVHSSITSSKKKKNKNSEKKHILSPTLSLI